MNPIDEPPEENEDENEQLATGAALNAGAEVIGAGAEVVGAAAEGASAAAEAAGGAAEAVGGALEGCGGCAAAILFVLFGAAGSAMAFFR